MAIYSHTDIHLHAGDPITNVSGEKNHWIELGNNVTIFASAEAAEGLIIALRAHIESLSESKLVKSR